MHAGLWDKPFFFFGKCVDDEVCLSIVLEDRCHIFEGKSEESVCGAYSTQWRYIVHVINSNLGYAIYSMASY